MKSNIIKLILTMIGVFMSFSSYSYDSLPNSDTEFGVAAKNIDFSKLPKIKIPDARGEKIPTMNQTGYMKTELDPYSESFIKFAANSKKPALEIGTAYGVASIEALKKGATIIANDIEEKHLIALLQNTPKDYYNNLFLKPGSFPDEIELPENSISSVLICRVAHFFTGEQIETGFKKIHKWLIPGGKLYFVSLTPYHHLLRDNFLQTYIKNYDQGVKWPGLITNFREYNPKEADDIPNLFHVFDDKLMKKLLTEIGFDIEEMTYFDYSTNMSDQKGYIGFIAEKK